jgi:large subunit ribosomal protein L3
MKFIIGKKIEMTQVWQGDVLNAVTKIKVGPCVLTQIKSQDKDGYSAAQVGYGLRKEKNIAKPQRGHFKKMGNFEKTREFRLKAEEAGKLNAGDAIDINSFVAGDKIQLSSISKGKGFQGVVKRHGFAGQQKTHGNKDQLRMPGSSGATGPAHVFKGLRMPGRMGGDKVTLKNVKIIEVDEKNSVISVLGGVPGARNSLVLLAGEGDLKVIAGQVKEKKSEEKAKPEEIKQEVEKKEEKPEVKENENNQVEKKEKDKTESPEIEKSKAEKTIEKKETPEEKKAETPEEVEKEVVEAKEKVDQKK